MESYNPHRVIVHLRGFGDVVFQLGELIIETLDYPDTYFRKWFMHVYSRGQQDRVGKDSKKKPLSFFYPFIGSVITGRALVPFCINGLYYLYRYARGAHSILVFVCLFGRL